MSREPKNRPQRTPLGQRNRLTWKDKDPNFVYRWINNQDARIAEAKEAGYEFVVSDEQGGDKRAAEASKMGAKVSKSVGGGMTGFLMRIPKEYYEEDQAAKAGKVNDLEKSLKPDKSKGQYGAGLTND